MQLFGCACILMLSIIVYYVLGKALCICCHWDTAAPETACIGFFFYFAVFQVIAEAMIFTKQPLHVLKNIWMVLLVLLLAAAAAVIWKKYKCSQEEIEKSGMYRGIENRTRAYSVSEMHGGIENRTRAYSVPEMHGGIENRTRAYSVPEMHRGIENGAGSLAVWVRLLTLLMAAAIVCECVSAVLMQRNIGWDFAYYIGNITTSVATDTMYLYDGSSGLLRDEMELRYALSSFYMNTAWISQLTGVSALLIQKYVMGILCVLLSNAIAYSFAMEVFRKERGKAALLVTITIVLTIFWDVYDTSAQFLMLRNYEAKAYCANVVLPMALFLLYRIWKKGVLDAAFGELFLVALSSVAVSMSSIVIVPALIGIMMLAHLIIEKRLDTAAIWRTACCMMPNVCYLAVYLCYTQGWLVVEV